MVRYRRERHSENTDAEKEYDRTKTEPGTKRADDPKNILITVGIMGAATIVCLALQHFSEADTHVPLLFVLAVVIVARFTEGYVYGILSAMAAVVLVNYVFTYPYFELNFFDYRLSADLCGDAGDGGYGERADDAD